MSGVENGSHSEPIDRDVDALIYASQENQLVDAPEISEIELAGAMRLVNALARLRDAERDEQQWRRERPWQEEGLLERGYERGVGDGGQEERRVDAKERELE